MASLLLFTLRPIFLLLWLLSPKVHATDGRLRPVMVCRHNAHLGWWQSALNCIQVRWISEILQVSARKMNVPCQLKDRHKQREVLKIPEVQITLKKSLDGFSWKTKVILHLLPENLGPNERYLPGMGRGEGEKKEINTYIYRSPSNPH